MEKDVVRKSLKRYSVRMKKSHERHHTIAALHPAGQRLSPIYGIYSYVTDILIASTAVMVIPIAKIYTLTQNSKHFSNIFTQTVHNHTIPYQPIYYTLLHMINFVSSFLYAYTYHPPLAQ